MSSPYASEPPDGWRFTALGILPAHVARTLPYFSAMTEQQLADLRLYVTRPIEARGSAREQSMDGPAHVSLTLDTFDANAAGTKVDETLWVREGMGKVPGCFDESVLPTTSVDPE